MDGDFCFFIYFWFGMVGNFQFCCFDYWQVIGFIVNCYGLCQWDFIFLCEVSQSFCFVLCVYDVVDYIVGKFIVYDFQFIGYYGGQVQFVVQVFSKESKVVGGNCYFLVQCFQFEYQLC